MHLFKVNLPCIVSLSNRDFDHAPSFNVGCEVKDVLWRKTATKNIKHQHRSQQTWKQFLLASWGARVTSWRHVYCTWYGAPFSSPSISTLIWRRMAPDTADLSVLFSVRQGTHIVDRFDGERNLYVRPRPVILRALPTSLAHENKRGKLRICRCSVK